MKFLLRYFANIFFFVALNIKGIKCSPKISISYRVFFYFIKSKISKVNLGSAILGSGVQLSDGVHLYNSPEIFGDVLIGKYSSINGPSTRICSEINKIIIGSYCSIASNTVIQEYYHNYSRVTTYNIMSNRFNQFSKGEKISKGPILISDDVWIGSNCVILSGVSIGRGAIVGAGSVVTKDVKPYSIVAGNPARHIRFRFSEKTISNIEESRWWLWEGKELIDQRSIFEKEFN